MRSTFALLAYGLAATTATPLRANKRQDDESGLTPGMTCNELKSYYGSIGEDRVVEQGDWDELDVGSFFEDWVNGGDRSQDFEEKFARPWGVGDSWRDNCDFEQGCPVLDCDSLGDAADEPDSAAAYMVMLSLSHLQHALYVLSEDINQAYNDFDATSAWFVSNFATDTIDDEDNLLTKSLLTGIGAGITSAAVLGGVNPITAAAVAFNGLLGGINNAVNVPEDAGLAAFETLADMQEYLKDAVKPAQEALEEMFNDLKLHGIYNDVGLTELLEGGAWLDSSSIAVLSESIISTSERQSIILSHINAAAINWAWTRSRVFSMSFPMSQEDFDNTDWYAGNGDTRLRYWDSYSERGMFFMSVYPQKKTVGPEEAPRIQNPPGWGEIDTLGFSTWDVLYSSYWGFDAGGYTATFDAEAFVDDLDGGASYAQDLRESIWAPAVFSVKQCAFEPDYDIPDAYWFNQHLAGPGAIGDRNDKGSKSPFCHCLGKEDEEGWVFEDFFDYNRWADSTGTNYCD